MDVKTTTTRDVTLTPEDLRLIIAVHVSEEIGMPVDPKDVTFSIYDGDPGGYGSMGDPAHVYNDPIPARFNGAAVKITTKN